MLATVSPPERHFSLSESGRGPVHSAVLDGTMRRMTRGAVSHIGAP